MPEIYFSYIIPTIGRKSLEIAVLSVLNQVSPQAEFEVVVVNDPGNPLRDADSQTDPRVQITDIHTCECSLARNTGAAMDAYQTDHVWKTKDCCLPSLRSANCYYSG